MQWMVVGVDGSENSRRALEWAFEEARLRNARLEVVHVWKTPHMAPYELTAYNTKACEEAARRVLDEMVPERPSVEPVAVEKILVRGSAARGLLEASKGADLLVVGSRGQGGFAGLLLGSVGHQLACHASCPVVVVPPEHEPAETEAQFATTDD